MKTTKTCTKCKKDKGLDEFNFRSKTTGGLRADCKDCVSIVSRAYYLKNQEAKRVAARVYAKENKAERSAYQKVYREANRKKLCQISRDYYETNRERLLQYQKDWKESNPNYERDRYRNDVAFRLRRIVSARVSAALGSDKSCRTIKLLGCDADHLKRHLESQFKDGMDWGQRGLWHVDHHLPLAAFDLTDLKQQRYAFHWSNLSPLWAEENQRKSDKYCPDELAAYLKSKLPTPSL